MTTDSTVARVTELHPPVPGATLTEPHVALDPRDPRRIAVAAMQAPPDGTRIPRSVAVWQTTDAGTTWRGDRVHLPLHDDEGFADPLVGYAPDGTLLVVGMAMSKRLTDAIAPGGYDRATLPALDEVMAKMMADMDHVDFDDTIVAVRVAADGSASKGVVLHGSAGADKPALVIDAHQDSPHCGTVYVAWHDMAKFGMLRVARSTDGGRTFTAPVAVIDGPPWGNFISQLAVRPDGSLHIVWAAIVSTFPSAPPEAATSLWHVVSRDGGQTFSAPVPIATHAGLPLIGIPALGMAPDGTLLVVWGQGSELPGDPLAQVRHRLYGVRSEDGQTWSSPRLLCPDVPPTTAIGLPAVASDGRNWWILAYLADERTDVVLLRADHDSTRFTKHQTLASRPIDADDIYLHGNYLLMRCRDVVRVGDYVGLAASPGQVVAGFVLPENDEPLSRTATYTAVVRT